MNYTDFMYALGDGILWTTDILFDNIGNIFNYAIVLTIMFGMVYWVNLLLKYKKRAAEDPNYLE